MTKTKKDRIVKVKMLIHTDGRVSFMVRGYDFRYSDMPIDVNGYLFAPVRSKLSNQKESLPAVGFQSDGMTR